VLTIGVFAALSVRNPISVVDATVLGALSEHFSLHWATLLPAGIMLLLSLLKVPVKWAMAISSFCAFALAVFVQDLPFDAALRSAILGYKPVQPELQSILTGGGLISMVSTCLIVFITSLYAGILEGIDALASAHIWVERLAQKIGLFPTSIVISAVLAAVFCNQSVAVLMDEQLLSESYRKRGASRTELAIDISNSGVMIAGLIPWSIAISVPLSMLDMGNEAILWCVLLYLIPLCYLPTKRFFRPGQNVPSERT
jgi:NhaC family Na+:H+ antiporter